MAINDFLNSEIRVLLMCHAVLLEHVTVLIITYVNYYNGE